MALNRSWFCFISLLLVFSLIFPLQAQTRRVQVVPRSESAGKKGQRWAVIIGIDRYPDAGITDLRYAVADARSLYQTLTTMPGGFPAQNVMLLTDQGAGANRRPTRSNIITQLTAWLQLPGPEDTALIYFAGHGIEKEGKSYLLPQDAALVNLGLTSLELDYFKEALRQCPARKKLLIVDACHSGAGRDEYTMGTSMAQALSRASQGMVVLASCDLHERSHEMPESGHGAFTYFLIEALRGSADRDRDGLLVASEVNQYVWDRTRRWAASKGLQQNPKYISAVSGDIVLGQVQTSAKTAEKRPPLPQPVPAEDTFSLADLQQEAARREREEEQQRQREERIKAEWQGKLQAMEQSFSQVQQFVQDDIQSDLKQQAWQKFLDIYRQDNPYSRRDDELRRLAREQYDYWKTHYQSSLGMEFVLIPAGEFMMGSTNGDSDEQPVHRVVISEPFYMGKYEVTQGQWEEVMGNNPSGFKGANRPVESVSWNDVQEFIRRLNAKEGGNNYRLPTEAEWEYACRAGSRGDYAGELDATGWYGDNSGDQTHPVGQKQPNAWGSYDMHGNVREWVQDWYKSGYYKISPELDPTGPGSGSRRVVRGGSWRFNAGYCRSANRFYYSPGYRGIYLGFRLVRRAE